MYRMMREWWIFKQRVLQCDNGLNGWSTCVLKFEFFVLFSLLRVRLLLLSFPLRLLKYRQINPLTINVINEMTDEQK